MVKKMITPYYLSTDFETTGFDTPVENGDGTYTNGAEYHDILSGTFRLLSKDKTLLASLRFVVVHPQDRLDRASEANREFHKKVHPGGKFSHADFYQSCVDKFHREAHRLDEAVRSVHHNYYGLNFLVFESYQDVENTILNSIEECQKHMEKPKPLYLLGKSVGFDRNYIMAKFPGLTSKLSHRVADVSVVANVIRQSSSIDPYMVKGSESTHHSDDDCRAAEALHEAQMTLFENLARLSNRKGLDVLNEQLERISHSRVLRWFFNLF